MSNSKQLIVVVGFLAADSTFKEFENGDVKLQFRVLVTERLGSGKEHTEGFNCEYRLGREPSEKVRDHYAGIFRKGAQAWVQGAIRTSRFNDEDGETRFISRVMATDIACLKPPPVKTDTGAEDARQNTPAAPAPTPPAPRARPEAPVTPATPPAAPLQSTAPRAAPAQVVFDDPESWATNQ